MEPCDLNRMFDALAPTPEQEQAGLDRLLQTERKVVPMKKLKKLTVAGIAAALIRCPPGLCPCRGRSAGRLSRIVSATAAGCQ